ncbi:MAG: right-handed parallel beta-helix repeat-containing protein [Chloroflexi bacterium]|nr:right-handed parallel beta-helix repeat-containing protein [Chloroflexota bacterium]
MNPKCLDEPSDVVLAVWQEQLEQAKDKPWLASLLLRQGEQIYRRFAYFYAQMLALPRKTRRLVQKRLATTLVGAALLLALAGPIAPAVHAATITVHPGSTGVNGSDGGCSLVEAILTANTGTYSSADCDGGTAGADTITLAGNTYSYSSFYGVGLSILPHITSDITIDANSATIHRASGGGYAFRIESGGNLTLNEATLTGSFGDYAAVYNNESTATINNCTITGSAGPAVYNFQGTTTVNSSTISGNIGGRAGMGVYNAAVELPAVMTINNSTITNNNSTGSAGGGIANGFIATAVINLNQTIVSGNSSSSGGSEIYNFFSGVINSSQNVLGEYAKTDAQAFYGFTPSGTDKTATSDGSDPTPLTSILNTTLANNGTKPHPFTHALVSGSPAIDSIPIDGTTCIAGITVDQRGAVRADGVNMGGTACDAGAFEYASSQTPTAVTIQGLMAQGEGQAGTAVVGVTGVLALLTGGWLAGVRRRKAK